MKNSGVSRRRPHAALSGRPRPLDRAALLCYNEINPGQEGAVSMFILFAFIFVPLFFLLLWCVVLIHLIKNLSSFSVFGRVVRICLLIIFLLLIIFSIFVVCISFLSVRSDLLSDDLFVS